MRTLLSFLCFCCITFNVSAKDVIAFQEKDFYNIQLEALRQNKVFFVYYYGKHCPPCELMKERTFSDSKIIKAVNDNFIAAKIKLNSTLGREWRDQSKTSVIFMPTIVFFSPQGKFINKYDQWISPSKLEDILAKNQEIGEIMSRDSGSDTSRLIAELESKIEAQKRAYELALKVPKKTFTPPRPKVKKKAKKVEKPTQLVALTPKQEAPKSYPRASYMVQIGAFSQKANINKYINDMKDKIQREDIHFVKDTKGAKVMYRVVTGDYASMDEAMTLVATLEAAGIRSFVRKY